MKLVYNSPCTKIAKFVVEFWYSITLLSDTLLTMHSCYMNKKKKNIEEK